MKLNDINRETNGKNGGRQIFIYTLYLQFNYLMYINYYFSITL